MATPISDPWKWPQGEYPIPPVRVATPIAVYRYNGPGDFTELPNVRCLSIETAEGQDPGQAMFRYVMDSRTGGPYTLEQCLGTQYTGPLVVEPGDRLCVLAQRTDGVNQWIFDGYPMGFGGQIDGTTEGVALQAIGVAKRAFDTPIGGQLVRHGDDPTGGDEVQTGFPVQFNPKGKPNATPADGDAWSGTARFPCFLDPLLPIPQGETTPLQRPWTLPMIVNYLQQTNNADQEFVKNVSTSDLDKILIAYEPKPGVPLDPNDPSTYTKKDILAADTPLSGERWPTAVRKMTEDYGFGMKWRLVTTADGNPETRLTLWWNQSGPVKTLYLAARLSDFDPAWNNIGGAELERDISDVVNAITAEGGLKRYEVSFVLACGFPSELADASSDTALAAYKEGDPAFATSANFNKYRLYILDELGEGHYAPHSTTKLTNLPDLSALFGDDGYVHRYRKPIGELLTTDFGGKPLHWRVAISKDFIGPWPALWDGGGTWQHVEGGVSLLKDRIGVRINVDDPNKWRIGDKFTGSGSDAPPFPSGIVKAVQCQAAPDAENPRFSLRLTCVIEGDQVAEYAATRQDSSPIPWAIAEKIDARDRLGLRIVAAQSEFNATDEQVVLKDDVEFLKAEAISMRTAKEAGVFESSITIPYFTTAYLIGDRISGIEGRGLGFRTDGGGSDVAPVYPQVVGVRWDFECGQKTHLKLSDKGLNHRQLRRPRTHASKQAIAREAARLHPTAGFVKGSGGINNGIADWVAPSERDNS